MVLDEHTWHIILDTTAKIMLGIEPNATTTFSPSEQSVEDVCLHTMVLALLWCEESLPPYQQSPTKIAQNLTNSLGSIISHNAMLEGIEFIVDFTRGASHKPINPLHLRGAMAYLWSHYNHDSFTPKDMRIVLARAMIRWLLVLRSSNHPTPVVDIFPSLDALIVGLLTIDSSHRIADISTTASTERVVALIDSLRLRTNTFQNEFALHLWVYQNDIAERFQLQIIASLYGYRVNWLLSEHKHSQAPLLGSDVRYDTVIQVLTDTNEENLSYIPEILSPIGQAVFVMTQRKWQRMSNLDKNSSLRHFIDTDTLQSVITLRTPQIEQSITIVTVRVSKAYTQRQSVIIANIPVETTESGDIILDEEILKEISSSFAAQENIGTFLTIARKKKLLEFNEFPSVATYQATEIKAQTSNIPLFGGIPRNEYVLFTQALSEHGIDLHHLFIASATGFMEFAPAFDTKNLLRIAVESSSTIKHTETHLYYQFATWWYRNEPLVLSLPQRFAELEDSFFRSVLPGALLDRTAQAGVLLRWMNDIRSDTESIIARGAEAAVRSWLEEVLALSRKHGVDIWNYLDPSHHSVLEVTLPSIMRRIHTSRHSIDKLHIAQQDVYFNGAEAIIRDLLQKKSLPLFVDERINTASQTADIHEHSSQRTLDERIVIIEERIAELHYKIVLLKQQITLLHQKAKNNPALATNDGRELFDSTLALQDQLGGLIAELVPAQSEVRLLEHSIKPYSLLRERAEQEEFSLERMTENIVPALENLLPVLTVGMANTIILDIFRQRLQTLYEARIVVSREQIITKLESWWDKYCTTA